MAQNNISDVQQCKNCYYVEITRRNGTTYRVKSDVRDAVVEYRREFLEFARQRGR